MQAEKSSLFQKKMKKIRGELLPPDLFIDFWLPFIPTFPVDYKWGQGIGSHPL